jgi:hypothetical protein
MEKSELIKKAEKLEAQAQELREKAQEENYCVKSFKQVGYDIAAHNLLFGNGCAVFSREEGDGILIPKSTVEGYRIANGAVYIFLKGTKEKDLRRFKE